jgi:hypothetical protein
MGKGELQDRMVIFPITDETVGSEPVVAWQGVQAREQQDASEFWMITQPAHAALAGDLAAALKDDLFGPIDLTVSRSIALHDAGWSMEDADQIQQLRANPKLKPHSFLNASVDEFLGAWTKSIETAEKFAPVGGYVVSRHFERLSERDAQNDAGKLARFRAQEKERQKKLRTEINFQEQALERLVDALQFCDLLSLYLCSGSKRSVKFDHPKLTLTRVGDEHRLDPFPFREHQQFSFSAMRHPAARDKKAKPGAVFYVNL